VASNIKAPPGRNMRGASETRGMSLPLLDFSDAGGQELIHSAKKRGHITVHQINAVLPSKEANSELNPAAHRIRHEACNNTEHRRRHKIPHW
jgi:hypothetical protein